MTLATVMSYMDMAPEKTVSSSRSAEEILKATQTQNPLSLLLQENKLRLPAAAVVPDKKETLKADVFCSANSRARFKKVPQSLVMLDLNICTSPKSNRHIWVKNLTNGFKAQVFKTGETQFRTDFIQLSPGNNRVIIESVLKDGQKRSQSLEIISGS